MQSVYFSRPVVASYDGEVSPVVGGGGSVAPSDDAAAKLFTQQDLNRIVANDRRKDQAALQRAEKALQEVSESKNLTVREREALEQRVEEMQAGPANGG